MRILSPANRKMDLDFLGCFGRENQSYCRISMTDLPCETQDFLNTVELQWLKHLWDRQN